MVTQLSPLMNRIREASKELNITQGRDTLAASVKNLTNRALSNWGAVTPVAAGGAFGLESYGEVSVKRNEGFDPARDSDPSILMRGLKDMGMADRHIEQVTESCLMMFDRSYNPNAILRGGEANQQHVSLSNVVGRTSAVHLSRLDDSIGTEAFGDDINRLNTDERLTMDLVIMRPWENIMDKALARVNESSPTVTIRIPAPEAWDWSKTQKTGSTVDDRFGSNKYSLRDLYRNPAPVNSAAKKIVAKTANDSKSVLWNSTTEFYKSGVEANILDLSRDSTVFTYDHLDRTDLVSDGGTVDGIIILLKSGATSEFFKISTRSFDLSHFTMTPSTKSSGQRQVIMDCATMITATTTQYNGDPSTIAAQLTDAKVRADIRITATLNLQTGNLMANGSVSLKLVQLADGTAISAPTTTLFGGLTTDLVAYSVDVYFDEENQRKANLAVWCQYYEVQFVVPRSRIYFTEYSLSQDVDDNAVAATSSIVALGNGRRGLDIVVNALNDISRGLEFAAANPELASINSIDEQSFASSLVKPTVVKSVLDFDVEDVNTMNESTRLSEIHGRFRARFLSMITQLFAKSLMLNQYKGGETPVIKAWVHSTIADLVIGITDYHPDLKDKATSANGADYSMVLPNGYRLDVIKSNLDCLQQRIYAVPIIESAPASVLSAASIRDCGTVTTNYSPSNQGSVVRRVATTTREIVMMSNRVGVMLEVKGLGAQLGTSTYGSLALSADHSEALNV